MKKVMLLLGLALSTAAMADVVEVRVGGDLTNRATFKDSGNSTWKINKDVLKRGFEIAGEYRTEVMENLEIGGGIAYKYNKLSDKKFPGLTMKGLNSVPVYFTTRYNFKNASEINPYVKANLGVAFNSGKIEAANATDNIRYKYNTGIYYGVGAGIQYKNFVTDLSYNINTMRTKFTANLPSYGYRAESKFNTNHGALTLGVGYSFGL